MQEYYIYHLIIQNILISIFNKMQKRTGILTVGRKTSRRNGTVQNSAGQCHQNYCPIGTGAIGVSCQEVRTKYPLRLFIVVVHV